MKTEISFLLELVLNHKLPPEAKKLCLERIGEVETSLQRPLITHPTHYAPGPQKSAAQIKFEQESAPQAQVVAAAPLVLPPAAQRIVGGEVNTGNGTRGPRKF